MRSPTGVRIGELTNKYWSGRFVGHQMKQVKAVVDWLVYLYFKVSILTFRTPITIAHRHLYNAVT